jgi:hypothetical protein
VRLLTLSLLWHTGHRATDWSDGQVCSPLQTDFGTRRKLRARPARNVGNLAAQGIHAALGKSPKQVPPYHCRNRGLKLLSFLTLALLLAAAVGVVSQHTDAAGRRQVARIALMTFKNKIKGMLAVLIISMAGISMTQHPYAARADWVRATPPSQMQEDYSKFNSQWFAGHLPANVIVKYAAPPDRPDTMGLTDVVDGHFVIYVDPKYHANSKAADMTLLHEICHISVWDVAVAGDDHGVAWKACMVGLAERGAFDRLW